MTWVVKRKRILPSCWGPGVMLPSCRFRGGQRPTLPETCSACAHTGSQSTDTSTTTRYHKQNTHTRTYFDVSRFWHIASRRWAEASCSIVPVLEFHNHLLWDKFINTPQSKGYNELLHQFLLILVCVVVIEQIPAAGISSLLQFSCSKCSSPQYVVSSLWWISACVFLATQTSVFTPAYGSVTNVRVNSSMTTGQVLNLLLHKFRVSRIPRCHTWTWD